MRRVPRPGALALAAALAASAFPAEAAEVVARAPFLPTGVGFAPTLAAPLAVGLSSPLSFPALAPGLSAPAALSAAPRASAAAAALSAAADEPSPAAATPAASAAPNLDAAGSKADAESAAGPAPAPATEEGETASADGREKAAANAGAALERLRRRNRGLASPLPAGPLARAARAVARATGLASLWGVYSDGVLVQRHAERLADESAEPRHRALAARRLGALGRVDAVPVLGWSAENDSSRRVRRAALASLLRLTGERLPSLIRTLKRNVLPLSRETAAANLGVIVARTDAPEALDALGAAVLLDRSEGVRLAAVAALAGARSPKADPILGWAAAVETRPFMRAAIERAIADRRASAADGSSRRYAPPAEDLPLAANSLHAAALKSSIAVGLFFAAVEFAGGVMTGTLALKADSLHLAGDRMLDAAALLAMWISRRPPTSRKTYGWLKVEALMSFTGALAIAAMAVAMIPGAVEGFVHPAAAQGWDVLGFAALSIVSNLASAWMLHRHQSAHLGIRGAFLHALTDAVGTFGVMVAAAASLLFHFPWLMPIATTAMVLMVLRVAWELGSPSWDALLDAVPPGVDMNRLETDLASVAGVAAVYDLHVRTLNSRGAELVAKVWAEPGADNAAILASANAFLRERYGIVHATIQIETAPAPKPAAPSADALLARVGAELRAYGEKYGIRGLEGRLQRGLDPAGTLAVGETRAKLAVIARRLGASLDDVTAFTNELHVGGIWQNAGRLRDASAPEVKAWIIAAAATTDGEAVKEGDLSPDEFAADYARVNQRLEAASADPERFFAAARARLIARSEAELALRNGVPFAKTGNGFLAMAVSGYKSGIVIDAEGRQPFVGALRLDYDALMRSRGLTRVSREDRGRLANFYVDADGRELVKEVYPGLAIVLNGDMDLAEELARAAR